MSQAEYSSPGGRPAPVTTGMAAENVAPPSVERAYLGPSGDSQRRWIVPPASARATTGRPSAGTAIVVTRPGSPPAKAAGGQSRNATKRAGAGRAFGVIMAV